MKLLTEAGRSCAAGKAVPIAWGVHKPPAWVGHQLRNFPEAPERTRTTLCCCQMGTHEAQ